ncbi:MAG: beta-N-acetylglucosaminidase domain-containing protein [bacterium]|nr:beta-N-acetylglucosaminidase domain-containing protein [bacterium]
MSCSFAYGVIEGFYGRSWSWKIRKAYADFLKANGFGFYIYAPKADAYLRRKWRESWPESQAKNLMRLASVYADKGVAWGIGFSPFEIYLRFDGPARQALEEKVRAINRFNPDILCVLLDDMKGDVPRLAETQAEVFQHIADLSTARRFILCPTYYTFDPILERIFGDMPEGYWSELGKRIDPAADIFWTGPRVCSTEYPERHLKDVADRLGRKPFIWDNYPVNDSEKMSRFLRLGAFENRPHQMSEWTAGHAVNPMNQAWLSQIPLKTLHASYTLKEGYLPGQAFVDAVESLCPPEFARELLDDAPVFQDRGLEGIDEKRKGELVEKYESLPSPYSEEIVDWLKGAYEFDPDCLTD